MVLAMTIIMVIVVITSAIVLSKSIVSPTVHAERKLLQIIQQIEKREGDLTERVPVESKDEFGRLLTISIVAETSSIVVESSSIVLEIS